MGRRGNIDALLDLSAGQWGMITSAQALRMGISRNQLSRMVSDGRLEPMVYGVYCMAAGSQTEHAMVKAAWLSIDPSRTAYERMSADSAATVVTGNTAANIYGYGDFYESPFCFAVATGRRTTRDDLLLLRTPIEGRDVSPEFDVPVATPERVVADLIRMRVDPSMVGGFLEGAAFEGRLFDRGCLSRLLSPLASTHDFPDGEAFADYLLERYAVPAAVYGSTGRLADAIDSAGPAGGGARAIAFEKALGLLVNRLGDASGTFDPEAFAGALKLLTQAIGSCSDDERAGDSPEGGARG